MGICKDGRYFNVYLGMGENGKPIRKRTKTLEEAKKLLATCKRSRGMYDAEILALPEFAKIELVKVMTECQRIGISLTELLDSYKDRNNLVQEHISFQDAIDRFIQHIMKKGGSPSYKASALSFLNFTAKILGYDKLVSDISFHDLQKCYFQKNIKSHKNYRTILVVFFNFCVRNNYIGENPATRLELPRMKKEVPPILQLAQIKQLLANCRDADMIAVLVMLFLGVRPREAERLKPNALDLKKKTLTIGAEVAKTRSFRTIPLPDVFIAWIQQFPHLKFHISKKRDKRTKRLAEYAGLEEWPRDVLRHTAASYMLARDKSADSVALQLGNSPDVLHRHYKNLVSDDESKEFWDLTPEKVGRK